MRRRPALTIAHPSSPETRREPGGGMNGLALCAGVGGLELGLHLALGDAYRTVGYVERDAYAAASLVARMGDAALDRAPVWDDLTTFDGHPWRGRVDLVSAGFPCQPASTAGARRGTDDDRWLWPDVSRVVRAVDPGLVFIENVPGLLSVNGGAAFGEVVETLAAFGFSAEWDVFSASEVGASHLRERLFLLAYADAYRQREHDAGQPFARPDAPDAAVGKADAAGRRDGARLDGRLRSARPDATVGHTDLRHVALGGRESLAGALATTFPPGPADADAWRAILAERPDLAPAVEPAVRGVADGLAHRVDRLRAAGNGVVPLVAAVAFLALAARAGLAMNGLTPTPTPRCEARPAGRAERRASA